MRAPQEHYVVGTVRIALPRMITRTYNITPLRSTESIVTAMWNFQPMFRD
jgi:hypothetical protein